MIYNVDYTDCKLLIRNEATGESIAQTKILEYNKERYSILVNASKFADQLAQIRLTLLIFTKDSIHVFGGIARKSFSPQQTEISMYRGKEHDDRAAKRYTANIDAVISNVIFPPKVVTPVAPDETGDAQKMPSEALHMKPTPQITNEIFNVKVLDLSTHGVRIQTNGEELEMDTQFTLRLNIADNPTCIKCKVVRCLESEQGGRQTYGCEFLSVESE